MLASPLSCYRLHMAKKRADKQVVELQEVPPATYEDNESLIPGGSQPAMPTPPEPPAEAAPAIEPVVAHPEWFRTINAGKVFSDGAVFHLAAGSLVSETTHNLSALRESGIAMEPADRLHRNLDAYGESS